MRYRVHSKMHLEKVHWLNSCSWYLTISMFCPHWRHRDPTQLDPLYLTCYNERNNRFILLQLVNDSFKLAHQTIYLAIWYNRLISLMCMWTPVRLILITYDFRNGSVITYEKLPCQHETVHCARINSFPDIFNHSDLINSIWSTSLIRIITYTFCFTLLQCVNKISPGIGDKGWHLQSCTRHSRWKLNPW